MRFILCAAALVCLASNVHAEKLIDSFSVIYREASDDYLFRARFNYDIESTSSPDAGISFFIYGDRPMDGLRDTLAILWEARLHDQDSAVLMTMPAQSFDLSLPIEFGMSADSISATIPRADILAVAPSADLLFPFHISAGRYNGESYQYPMQFDTQPLPVVAINVPEPSTLAMAAGMLLLLMRQCWRRLNPSRRAHTDSWS
jgi:hypothetical protein